jgi:hypothetical protein
VDLPRLAEKVLFVNEILEYLVLLAERMILPDGVHPPVV